MMKMTLLRTYFGIKSIISPEKAAEKGFAIFQRVRKKEIRQREIPFYQKAKTLFIDTETGRIDCFEFGKAEDPLILLVHGWNSNAGSMYQIAEKFAKNNYRVISFNLPGHAYYSSSSTNLIECKNVMNDVLNFINPTAPFSVVAHSFGAAVVATALADSNWKINRMVFLTNPNKIEDIFFEFKRVIGLGNKAYRALLRKTATLLGAPIQALDVSSNLQKINFEKLLLLHDINDHVLPYANSFQINSEIKNVQLISFENIGHYKMLWNPEVIGRTLAFIENREVL
jgi:pimeloyl-ACP methyl ester carboxylesterase